MGYNLELNPGGGTNLPDLGASTTAAGQLTAPAADPGGIRMQAGLRAVRAAVAHLAGSCHGADQKKAVELAVRTFIPAFAVAARVEHASLRVALGTYLPRVDLVGITHVARALDVALAAFERETGDTADLRAAYAVSHLDERDPLPPAERIAFAQTAIAVARFIVSDRAAAIAAELDKFDVETGVQS